MPYPLSHASQDSGLWIFIPGAELLRGVAPHVTNGTAYLIADQTSFHVSALKVFLKKEKKNT